VVLGVGGDIIKKTVDAQVLRPVERRLAGVAAVPRRAGLAGARDGRNPPLGIYHAKGVSAALQNVDVAGDGADGARLHCDGADTAVVEVGEVHLLALRIEGDAVDAADLRVGRRPA